jgi:hypothetical protein
MFKGPLSSLNIANNKIISIVILMSSVVWFQLCFTIINPYGNALPSIIGHYPTKPVNGKEQFDSTSEVGVKNRIALERLGHQAVAQLHHYKLNKDPRAFNDYRSETDYNPHYEPSIDEILSSSQYMSQIGVQSLFWAKVDKIFFQGIPLKESYENLKILCSLLLSTSLAVIVTFIHARIGGAAALVAAILTGMSTGLNLFSTSLYFSVFLFFFPIMLLCMVTMENYKVRLCSYPLLCFLFVIKLSSGYEFISTFGLCTVLPIFLVKDKMSSIAKIKLALEILLVFLIAFTVVVLIHSTEINRLHDSKVGISYIFSRAREWSGAELENNPFIQVVKILSLNYVDLQGYGIPIVLVLCLILAFLFKQWAYLTADDRLFLLVAISAPVSWCILQPYHILFHPRYATFLFAASFSLFLIPYLTHIFVRRTRSMTTVCGA